MNKHTSNSSKGCVVEVDLGNLKELRELNNDYPLAPDKIQIKIEMLYDYQLKIADLYNIPIGNVKKLVPNFFDKELICDSLWKLANLPKIRIEAEKNTSCVGIQSISMAKTKCWIQHTKKNRSRKKNGGKDEKAFYKLMDSAVFGKTMENVRNRIDVKLVSNKKKDFFLETGIFPLHWKKASVVLIYKKESKVK